MRTPAPLLTPAAGEILVLPTRAESGRPSDAQLVARALDGESWACEAIYRRYVNIVAATVRRMLRHRADTEDVVQDTFIIAFDQLAQLDDVAALRVWLVRIGVSRVHRVFRRRRVIAWLTGDEAATSLAEQAAPGLGPAERTELALLDRALATVAPARRTPWILRHVEGYAVGEIATICDCSPATVKRRIAEIDAKVRRHMQREGVES
jgi:RNA polymerase sigma-70 factor (ECF subfamily)